MRGGYMCGVALAPEAWGASEEEIIELLTPILLLSGIAVQIYLKNILCFWQ